MSYWVEMKRNVFVMVHYYANTYALVTCSSSFLMNLEHESLSKPTVKKWSSCHQIIVSMNVRNQDKMPNVKFWVQSYTYYFSLVSYLGHVQRVRRMNPVKGSIVNCIAFYKGCHINWCHGVKYKTLNWLWKKNKFLNRFLNVAKGFYFFFAFFQVLRFSSLNHFVTWYLRNFFQFGIFLRECPAICKPGEKDLKYWNIIKQPHLCH